MGLQVREFILELCMVLSKIDDTVVGTLLQLHFIDMGHGESAIKNIPVARRRRMMSN